MTHVMIDIETTGTKPGCRVLSIGACTFNVTGDLGNRFYQTIDPTSYDVSKAHDSDSTMEWWNSQGDDVRAEAFSGTEHQEVAFANFQKYLKGIGYINTTWCKGASFDFPIVEHWCSMPIQFWKMRCARTYLAAAGVNASKEIAKLNDNAHNALDDSLGQAKAMQVAAQKLGQSVFL